MTDNLNTRVLENLHYLISENVIGDKQYESRYKGFTAEFEFEMLLREMRPHSIIFSSLYMLPTEFGKRSIKNPVVFMVGVSTEKPDLESLKNVFQLISKIGCKKMFYINCISSPESFDSWSKVDVMNSGIPIPVPEFEVLKYSSGGFVKANILSLTELFQLSEKAPEKSGISAELKNRYIAKYVTYELSLLVDLYISRLFFDGFIGLKKKRGIPADIDFIVNNKNSSESFTFIEVKEKDLSKRSPVGFGMDSERINDIGEISTLCKTEYLYVVRQVADQKNRKFEGWKYISIRDFIDRVQNAEEVEGGTGMRSQSSSNPTKVCAQEHFKDLLSKNHNQT